MVLAITESNFPTAESRLERFTSWQDRLPKYFKRGVRLNPKNNVVAVLQNKYGEKRWAYGANICTDVGDLFYAQQAVNGSLTNDLLSANNRCELGNPVGDDTLAKADTYSALGSPIALSRKALTATYPKTADSDTDNTGATTDTVSWDYAWTVSDFNTESANNIRCGVVHIAGATPIAGSVLLSHWNFATNFEKTSSDTLKVFLNHRFNGI